MKKFILSIIFATTILSANAQDTICTMIRLDEVIVFDYQNSKIISSYDNKKTTIIKIGYFWLSLSAFALAWVVVPSLILFLSPT